MVLAVTIGVKVRAEGPAVEIQGNIDAFDRIAGNIGHGSRQESRAIRSHDDL